MKPIYYTLIIFIASTALAHTTNRNIVNSEFVDHISDKSSLDSEIRSNVHNATSSIGSGAAFEVFNPQEIDISHESLEDRGQVERAKQNHFDLLEVDYSKAGAKKHHQEVKELVSETAAKFKSLSDLLRKVGIDCNSIKTYNKFDTSPFQIDTKLDKVKEVEYKPNFCEQLQNTYNCISSLRIHCLQKAVDWHEWEQRSITIPGSELYHTASYLFYSHYVAKKTFEQKLISPISFEAKRCRVNFNSIPQMKSYLEKRFQYRKGSISNDMVFSWHGGTIPLGGKKYLWRNYVINYKYRNGNDICEKWSDEVWQESCPFSAI